MRTVAEITDYAHRLAAVQYSRGETIPVSPAEYEMMAEWVAGQQKDRDIKPVAGTKIRLVERDLKVLR
tara:strand:+ start:12935 stop:13138 length:204 start_codon:yes stop_codon:yes gene_type:complete